MKMKIGLDFDDVTVNTFAQIIDFYNKKFKKNHKKSDFKKHDFSEFWGISQERKNEIIDEWTKSHKPEDLKSIPGAIKSILKLAKKNKFIIITARSAKNSYRVTEWISKNLPKIKIPVMHSADFKKNKGLTKAQLCKKLKVQILIEDADSIALECADNGTKVLLFDQPWNKLVKHSNITRVKSWKEIVKLIK